MENRSKLNETKKIKVHFRNKIKLINYNLEFLIDVNRKYSRCYVGENGSLVNTGCPAILH